MTVMLEPVTIVGAGKPPPYQPAGDAPEETEGKDEEERA